jgi:hypothetical protein
MYLTITKSKIGESHVGIQKTFFEACLNDLDHFSLAKDLLKRKYD